MYQEERHGIHYEHRLAGYSTSVVHTHPEMKSRLQYVKMYDQ